MVKVDGYDVVLTAVLQLHKKLVLRFILSGNVFVGKIKKLGFRSILSIIFGLFTSLHRKLHVAKSAGEFYKESDAIHAPRPSVIA